MSDDKRYDALMEVGASQARVLVEMVAALACDYERLEELKEERESFEYVSPSLQQRLDAACAMPATTWATANPDEASELAELEEAAGECTSREEAEQRIHEDALSIEMRSGWETPDVWAGQEVKPTEYNILLATGGPAARITGELENGEPTSARLQVQDWGTPWTDCYKTITEDTLLTYARCFYFGEG